ncbi:MAG: GvpL/GvpF family gas vesicle protein [Elusimicrobiota bacterium]
MTKEGRYIYCIIETRQERNFGPIGIGLRGDDVLTIGYMDLSVVVSNFLTEEISASNANMLAHERVIEEVMKEFDCVLPVRFGTIAANAEEVRDLLSRRYHEFKTLLKDIKHMVEFNVSGTWKSMGNVYKEIVKENNKIRELKENLENAAGKSIKAKIETGKMVQSALKEKKTEAAREILDALKIAFLDYKLNDTRNDEMFMNAAFLIDKGREKEFDNIMDELAEKYKKNIKFMYTGAWPVFNFIDFRISPKEWEM